MDLPHSALVGARCVRPPSMLTHDPVPLLTAAPLRVSVCTEAVEMGASTEEILPLVIIWTDDLFIVPHLEDGLRTSGFRTLIIDHASAPGVAGTPLEQSPQLTEPIDGPDAAMLRSITEMRPALILVDTTCAVLSWMRWIQVLKTSAATRRIPILAFGPHVDKASLERAQRMGADHVVSRGRLQANLSELVEAWARPEEAAMLQRACESRLSKKALAGVRRLNAGDYYEAHEDLERAWMEAAEHEGYLYRALLQIAVTYLHIERGNHAGAVKMLLRVRHWLDLLPDTCRGVDVKQVRTNVEHLRESVAAADPEHIADLDRGLMIPIPFLETDTRSTKGT
jgi:predicted metal-dependent hydrolase